MDSLELWVPRFAAYPLSALLMLVYAGAADCPLLAWYILPWLGMVFIRRVTTDPNQHSRYQGYPWVFGWMAGEYVARLAEVFICFFGAVFLVIVDEEIARFVMAMIVSIIVAAWVEFSTLRTRSIAMRDARIEARHWR